MTGQIWKINTMFWNNTHIHWIFKISRRDFYASNGDRLNISDQFSSLKQLLIMGKMF